MSLAAIILVVSLRPRSLAALYGSPKIIEHSLFRPYWFRAAGSTHTIVTSGLVHARPAAPDLQPDHVLLLRLPAREADRRRRFAALYLIGLVRQRSQARISSIATTRTTRSLGASGAISAVLFASIVYFPGRSSSSSRSRCRSRRRSSRSVMSPTRGIRRAAARRRRPASTTTRTSAARWPASYSCAITDPGAYRQLLQWASG